MTELILNALRIALEIDGKEVVKYELPLSELPGTQADLS